jgi:hypothetical protein
LKRRRPNAIARFSLPEKRFQPRHCSPASKDRVAARLPPVSSCLKKLLSWLTALIAGMLWRMKPTSAFLLLGVFVMGCANNTIQVDKAASDFLGAESVHVLSAPTKLEGWNFQRPDRSIASDPPIQLLNLSIAKDLDEILLSRDTYQAPARGGSFDHAVGFRVWRGDQSVDVLLSFNNDQMQFKYRAFNGQPSSSFASFSAARDRLLKVVHEAFPEYMAGK